MEKILIKISWKDNYDILSVNNISDMEKVEEIIKNRNDEIGIVLLTKIIQEVPSVSIMTDEVYEIDASDTYLFGEV